MHMAAATDSPTATEGQIVLIGAGFGRTGTASAKIALELLGVGPTHHMKEVKFPSINTPDYDFSTLEFHKRMYVTSAHIGLAGVMHVTLLRCFQS